MLWVPICHLPKVAFSDASERQTSDEIRADLSSASGPLSEEGLKCLKAYRYSSVDKSLISHYLLRHYVLLLRTLCSGKFTNSSPVECIRRGLTPMAGTEHGDAPWLLLHTGERCVS